MTEARRDDTVPDAQQVEEAIRRVQEGEVEAYRIVVQAYHRWLRAAIAGSCPPGVDAEEVAHRTFIEAYKNIGRYELNTRFQTWLSVIAKNLLMAEYKKIKRQAQNRENHIRYLITDGMEGEVSSRETIEDGRRDALRACMGLLRESARQALEMRYTEDAGLEAIAQRIGKSVAAVKFELFAIRKKLRDCIRKKLAYAGG